MAKKLFNAMRKLIFYHVFMKNHWLDIVSEQLSVIISSGLYDATQKIYINCLGDEKDFIKTKELISKLDCSNKMFPVHNGSDSSQFEFTTLALIHAIANLEDEFHCLYIHTKGASFEKSHERGYIGGNYWRQHMNYYNIKCWRRAIINLESGFDTCGVKLRSETDLPAKRKHYSGNFWWANSSYLKKLIHPSALDKQNRFEAEFWIGSENPDAVSLCQDFVDYDTYKSLGSWHDPIVKEKKIGRTIVHTLCWNIYSEIEKAVTDLFERNDKDDFIHILVDLDFPVDKKNQSRKLKLLAKKFGSIYFKTKNIGVSQNWTQVVQRMKITEDDVLICCDPDERVKTNNWVNALSECVRKQNYGWVSLAMPEHLKILTENKYKQFSCCGHRRVWEVIGNLNWAQGAMNGKLIVEMGNKIPFLESHPVYGYLEKATLDQMAKLGYTWAMLPDYIVEHTDDVPLLREWKNLIIFDIAKYGQLSLEEFIDKKNKNLL